MTIRNRVEGKIAFVHNAIQEGEQQTPFGEIPIVNFPRGKRHDIRLNEGIGNLPDAQAGMRGPVFVRDDMPVIENGRVVVHGRTDGRSHRH